MEWVLLLVSWINSMSECLASILNIGSNSHGCTNSVSSDIHCASNIYLNIKKNMK